MSRIWPAHTTTHNEGTLILLAAEQNGFVPWQSIISDYQSGDPASRQGFVSRKERLKAAGYVHEVITSLLAIKALNENGRKMKPWTRVLHFIRLGELTQKVTCLLTNEEDAVFLKLLSE